MNNNISDKNRHKTKIIHRPIACLRWNDSYSLCSVFPNHQIIPMRRYITTALFFSTLLGKYTCTCGVTGGVMGVVVSAMEDIYDKLRKAICITT